MPKLAAVCLGCNAPYQQTVPKPYCPKCRAEYRARNAGKRPPKKPKAPKPQRPPKHKPQSSQFAPIPSLMMDQPVNSKTSRMKTTTALNAVSRSGMPMNVDNVATKTRNMTMDAGCRLMLAQLDCRLTQGQAPIMVNVDETVQPKLAYQYDTLVSIRCAPGFDAPLKVQLISSPVYCAKLWCPAGFANIGVSGARTVQINFETLYILGNKLGFVGSENDGLFTPAPDWARYRCLSTSAVAEWTGRTIDKNGTVKVARSTNHDDIQTFEPMQKADAVVINFDDPVSFASQHTETVLAWNFVDANDAVVESHGVLPLTEHFSCSSNNNLLGAFNVSPPSGFLSVTALTGAQTPTTIGASISSIFSTSVTSFVAFLSMFLSTLDSKWGFSNADGSYNISSLTILGRLRALPTQTGNTTLPPSPSAIALATFLNAINLQYDENDFADAVGVITPISMYNQIINYTGLAFAHGPPLLSYPPAADQQVRLGIDLDVAFKFMSNNIGNRGTRTTIKLTRALNDPIALEEGSNFFVDPDYLPPIALFEVRDLTMQLFIQSVFELMVEDTSPFTEMALATAEKSRSRTVQAAKMKTYVKAMKSLPPALALAERGLSRGATTQLGSRGALTDIVSMLGGLATTVLPGLSGVVGTVNHLASMVESFIPF